MAQLKEGLFCLGVNPQDMTQRVFRFRNMMAALHCRKEGLRLQDADPAIKSVSVALVEPEGTWDVTIATTHPSDWMSSSGKALGTERQVYVISAIQQALQRN